MNETYRMLGREHELDLEREASRRRLAAALPAKRRDRKASLLYRHVRLSLRTDRIGWSRTEGSTG